MGFLEAVKACFGKYATFEGRARRSEYWWFGWYPVGMDSGTRLAYLLGFVFAWRCRVCPSLALYRPFRLVAVACVDTRCKPRTDLFLYTGQYSGYKCVWYQSEGY